MTRRARPASATARAHLPNAVEWLAVAALAALLGVGVGTGNLLRAADRSAATLTATDAVLVRALGGPTGILAVINPATCTLMAEDVAALNAAAALPGVRVTVLALAVPAHDSVLRMLRRDFGFSPAVTLAPAATVDPQQFPELLRMPFVAIIRRAQLRHAAWGESLKSLSAWLPVLTGAPQVSPPPRITPSSP